MYNTAHYVIYCTAKQDAAKVYMPLLVISNIIYVALILGTSDSIPYEGTKWGIFGMIVTWLLQAYSYVGILESSASSATATSRNKDLAGGANLDLLAVTIAVQLLSALHSTRWFYVTVVGVPVVAAYKLYQTFYGGGTGSIKTPSSASNNQNNNDNSNINDNDNDPMAAKRQRRAEKRKQKWG